MSKIRISYELRQGMNGDLSHWQPLILCHDAFNQKDYLKNAGYRWNPTGKSWEKKVTDDSFMDEAVNVIISCGMTYIDFLECLPFIPEDIQLKISETALAKYNEYMDAHPEWF